MPDEKGEKSSAWNDQAATYPTPNPSQYVLVSFHLISRAVRPLQPTPSRSLFSKIQAKTTPKRREHLHHDTLPLKTRLVTLPPLQTKPHGGTTPSLLIGFRIKNCRCILLNILASIYLLESFTWIPIQIFILSAILNYAIWNYMY